MVYASENSPRKRVPAEWEPQAATWLQWPGRWERMFEPALARIAAIVSRHQKLHILYAADDIRARIEGYFPGREVYVVDMLESRYHGGGVHCHTNDQPAL